MAARHSAVVGIVAKHSEEEEITVTAAGMATIVAAIPTSMVGMAITMAVITTIMLTAAIADGSTGKRCVRAVRTGGADIAIARTDEYKKGSGSNPEPIYFQLLSGDQGLEVPVPAGEVGARAFGLEPAAGSVGVDVDGPG